MDETVVTTEPAEEDDRDLIAVKQQLEPDNHGPHVVSTELVESKQPKDDEAKKPPWPRLLCGQLFRKEIWLQPGVRVRMGRAKECSVGLSGPGVSNYHCTLTYNSQNRSVELRDESTTGTYVEDKVVRKGRVELHHADWIRIKASQEVEYHFLLDLRRIGEGFADPRDSLRTKLAGKKNKYRQPGQALSAEARRQGLRSQIQQLEEKVQDTRTKIAARKKELLQLQERAEKRKALDKEREAKCQKYLEDKAEIERKLVESRKRWMEQLRAQKEKHDLESQNLVYEVRGIQETVERLQLDKDTLERTLHPERYAVVDVARLELEYRAPEPAGAVGAAGEAEGAAAAEDEAEGEEEYVMDAQGRRVVPTEKAPAGKASKAAKASKTAKGSKAAKASKGSKKASKGSKAAKASKAAEESEAAETSEAPSESEDSDSSSSSSSSSSSDSDDDDKPLVKKAKKG